MRANGDTRRHSVPLLTHMSARPSGALHYSAARSTYAFTRAEVYGGKGRRATVATGPVGSYAPFDDAQAYKLYR